MSEQERKAVPPGSDGPSVVLVDQTASRHKYKHPEPDEPEAQTKRIHAPSVPSVTEEVKDTKKHRQHSKHVIDTITDHLKQRAPSAPSTTDQKKEIAPEAITLTSVDIESKRGSVTCPEPIPEKPDTLLSTQKPATDETATTERVEDEEDSIKEDVAELRSPQTSKKPTVWSEDEEAGGLPRTMSRSSRVSRSIRQLFCCGAAYEAPSDDDVTSRRWSAI